MTAIQGSFNKTFFISMLMGLLLTACESSTKQSTMIPKNKKPDQQTENNRRIISAPIVKSSFVKKNGEVADIKEYYISRSIQNYFIKFCESSVTKKDILEALEEKTGLIKTLTLEVEFRDGEWDRCGEEEVESRIGEYVIVLRIIQ